MVTRKFALEKIGSLITELKKAGYSPERAYLFGSVAKGSPTPYSDIDLALWDKQFTGVLHLDYEPIKKILINFKEIELHTFNNNETEKINPFIREIVDQGISVEIQK